jgi:hypothetical protein
MAKSDKNMEFFRQGMLRAYQLASEDGIEALEKELRFRNVTKINGPMLAKELDNGIDQIKRLTYETLMAMTVGVLYSEFGFGKKRIERFREAFEAATDGLQEGIVTWADICFNIEDLTGFRAGLIDHLSNDTGMIRED